MTETVSPSAVTRHFERSSLALVANTILTGGLGTVFWLVAARLFPESVIGPAVATSSLLLAIGFAAQLNLATALSRFLPGEGHNQRQMVLGAYAIAGLCGCVLALGVLAVAAARGGEIVEGGDVALAIVLAASIPVWVVFALQDAALVAVRRSAWVPIENALVNVAKVAVLPVAAAWDASAAVLLAWTVPTVLAIAPVNAALFHRFLARGRKVIGRGQLLGYAVRDLPGALLFLGSLRVIPLIVLESGEPLDAAYVGLPWTIITVAALALPALSRSLLAELSHGDTDADELLGRVNRLVLGGMLPLAVIAALLADPVLRIAGSAYADRGSGVLAWGIVGLVPAALIECRLAALRFRDKVSMATAVQSTRALALVAGVVALIQSGRTPDIGVAFAAINALALVVVVSLVALDRRRHPEVRRA